MGDDDRSQTKLFFIAQTDRDRTGVDRQRFVDQIGGQQLTPAITRAWNNLEFHYLSRSRICARALLPGLISSSRLNASRAPVLSPLSSKAMVRFWSAFS